MGKKRENMKEDGTENEKTWTQKKSNAKVPETTESENEVWRNLPKSTGGEKMFNYVSIQNDTRAQAKWHFA